MKETSQWRSSVVLVILGLMLTAALGAVPCNATEVWSERFDDRNLDEWFHDSYANANDFALRASRATEVYRPCNLSCGVWSFDVLDIGDWQDEWGPGLYVYFMSSDPESVQTYYCLRITKGTVEAGLKYIYAITKMYEGEAITLESADGMEGSDLKGTLHHIKVTRTAAGRMSVHVNKTLMVEATDNEVSTSECFRILLKYDYAIDNIVVDDAVDSGISIELLAIGGGIAAVVLVTVVIVKRR